MENLFQDNPINYALKLVEDDFATEGELLCACLKFMSHDQIRDMLRENDLSPNVIKAGEDEISNEERFACELYNERFSYSYAD